MISPEFYLSTCVIPDLTKKISTVRSRGISMSVIFQNIPQMMNRYPNNQWLEICGNCDVQLFLGCTDRVTAEYISERSGEITVSVHNESKKFRTLRVSSYVPEYNETKTFAKRRLLTSDEVLRLPVDEALVILRGHKIFKVKKFDYTRHHEADKLIFHKASEHIPNWYKQINSKRKKIELIEKNTEAKIITEKNTAISNKSGNLIEHKNILFSLINKVEKLLKYKINVLFHFIIEVKSLLIDTLKNKEGGKNFNHNLCKGDDKKTFKNQAELIFEQELSDNVSKEQIPEIEKNNISAADKTVENKHYSESKISKINKNDIMSEED